jgi:5-methylcytosine-specific restriction protein A
MPYTAKHICAHPGCNRLTDKTYCDIHGGNSNKHYERYNRSPDTALRYGSDWRKVRSEYLATHPLCELCAADGRTVPAVLVHHLKPLSDGGTNDWDNLQSLCQACHSRLHASERGHWG